MVCESPARQKSLIINKRGKFFGDPFFRDSWADYNSAVKRIVDRFNHGWVSTPERIRESQYHSMYRTLRSAKQNYSSHSARFKEEVDCYKLVMDVHEYVGGDITVRTAGKTVSVRGKVEADSNGIATLRTEKGTREENDTSSIISGTSSSSKTLHRRYTLPAEANCDKIESALSKDAVLTVTIPKRTDVRYIPMTIEGKGDNINSSRRKGHHERNCSMKRPNDSPLLSSRKKSQDEHDYKANVPWRSRYDENNKENNSTANADSVFARRSRFEKHFAKNSVDDNKQEIEPPTKSDHHPRDKYEEAREVTIPITFNDDTEERVYTFKKENKNNSEFSPKEEEAFSKNSTSKDKRYESSHRPIIPEKTTQVGDYMSQVKSGELLNNKNSKDNLNTKIKIQDELISSINTTVKPKIKCDNKAVKEKSKLKLDIKDKHDNCFPWQRNMSNKRERSIDGTISSPNTDSNVKNTPTNEYILNKSSVKSPKLFHQAEIPHVNLFKPELTRDSEIHINKEDNLNPVNTSKLDTLDTPKIQSHKSASVTPGGREILVQKRQSLMEDDIFQDCWSDFSNTLQEVLNRLQELSSELGTSQYLANSTSESNQQKEKDMPTEPEIRQSMDSEMKKGSTSNDWLEDKDILYSESDKTDEQNTGKETFESKVFHTKAPERQGSNDESVKDEKLKDDANLHKIKNLSPDLLKKDKDLCEKDSEFSKISHYAQQQRLPLKSQSRNDSDNSFFDCPFVSEPVLESRLKFAPVDIDTQTSVRVNVLQPLTSVDLVSEKDSSSTVVHQSSPECLVDNNSLENTPVTDSCNTVHPKEYRSRDELSDYNNSVLNYNIKKNSEPNYFFGDDYRNEIINDKSRSKGITVASGTNNSPTGNINDLNSSHVNFLEKAKQRSYDKTCDYKLNIEARESPESNISDCETINKDKEWVVGENPISYTNKDSGDRRVPHSLSDTKGAGDYYGRLSNTCNTNFEANVSDDCEEIVDILNGDVMRRSAFSQNGANSPRGRSSHLSSAKSGTRRLADLQKEKQSYSQPEHCNAKSNISDANNMGSLLTRGKEVHSSGIKCKPPSTPNTPVLNENTNPLKYSYRKECLEEPQPVPSYVTQKSHPSRRFTGFNHVNSNNVRRMRDALITKNDNEESESSTPRNRQSPSPTRGETHRICSPTVDNETIRRSPSPMRSPMSPKNEPYSSFAKSSPFRQRQSFSPSRSDTEYPMNCRDSFKRSTPKSSYNSPTFSSSQKSCSGGNTRKPTNNYKCSSQDQKQFNQSYRKCDSPLLSPKNDRKDNSEIFNKFNIGSVPERKRQSEKSSFKPKYEPSYSPPTHQRIFKRFRNANLQPDSEAICFKEQEDKYKMVLDVEEFVPGEIEVLQDEGVLTVKGKVETKDGLHVSVRTFHRTFNIPKNSREEDIDSSLSEDGILTIFVPKKKERIIKIELVD